MIAFQTVHQYGGASSSASILPLFSILWMFIISLAILKAGIFPSVAGLVWLSCIRCVIYWRKQKLLETAIPDFPVFPEAGLIGSLLW